ncbi:MAG: aminoglycoside phosphotransferase family protein [Candidatus Abawacabacteria bacterium]|nr:aminoglycoside phosphotransferase family protein [Candidatus Abawacabacteria bacterium]
MPLPSLSAISTAFPAVKVTGKANTFQNTVLQGCKDQAPVYVKSYASLENYRTERAVLKAFNHLPPGQFRVPKILVDAEAITTLLLDKVPGEHIEIANDEQRLVELAVVLRSLHQERSIRTLQRVDLHTRLALFAKNIVFTDTLSSGEKCIAAKAAEEVKDCWNSVHYRSDQLVHGDMHLGNLLYHPYLPQPYAVIDFERAYRGDGIFDLAKLTWRALKGNAYASGKLLECYFARQVTVDEQRKLIAAIVYECLGSISYFAYRGHQEGYPYKDAAFNYLEQWML